MPPMTSAQGFVAASFKVSSPMGPSPNWATFIEEFRFIRSISGPSTSGNLNAKYWSCPFPDSSDLGQWGYYPVVGPLCWVMLDLVERHNNKMKSTMKHNIDTQIQITRFAIPTPRRLRQGLTAALLMFAGSAALASPAGYEQVNLVSDRPGVALLQDTNLVNAWGVSFSSASPFWISDNGTGKSTLYSVTNDSLGAPHISKLGLVVTIPGEGNPTGQVFNNLGGFNGDIFLFVSEDGTISGWRNALGTAAEVLTNRTGAVYKGVALANSPNGPRLLAANFAEGTLDAYGTNSSLVRQFSDPLAPAGYAPFNVQSVGG